MAANQMQLREARAEDHQALLAFEQKVIEAERPFNSTIKQTDTYYYDLAKLIADPNSQMLVGEINGVIIATGYIQLRESKPSLQHDIHGYLGFMYVAEEYRGQGLNKLILQALVAWGKTRSVTHFYLDVYAENAAAIRAYEKFGFRSSVLEMKLEL